MTQRNMDNHLAVDDDLSDEFVNWSKETVITLRKLLSDMPDAPRRGDSNVKKVYDLTHNMKGMGSSFGYSLLTAIGTSLCGYLKAFQPEDSISKKVLESHIRAQEVVVENGIKGSGGDKGEALTARLHTIIAEETRVP